ncbi:hypothetical protein JCM10213_006747 [Rhodosporidiobolus nylandii]
MKRPADAPPEPDYGGWQPSGEDPAEREKRMKREKRARQMGLSSSAGEGSSNPNSHGSVPAPPPAARRQDEDYGGWKPAEGESPAEREKRLKREKRAAKMAAEGGGGAGGHGGYGAPPHLSAPPTARRADEDYGGWKPAEGESPAEREKRLKREKRAAMMAAQGQGGDDYSSYPSSAAANHYPPSTSTSSAAPPAAAGGFSLAYGPTGDAEAEAKAEEEKKSKHAQSKTPARLKYLERKKKVRKAKKKALPKGAAGAAGSVREDSVATSAAAGEKRKRDDADDDDEASGSDGEREVAAPANAAGGEKWADLTPEEREKKAALIAEKKAQRREARLAKKAELKALKAAGLPAPAPKARVVERTGRATMPAPRERGEKGEGEGEEKSEEQLKLEEEERKKREEIEERKRVKALKKAQRRLPAAEVEAVATPATEEQGADADGDEPMLIPTAPPAASTSGVASPPPASEAATGEEEKNAPSRSPSPAPLLRLPSATRPAPPSAATLSALNVHAAVRGKVVVDPAQKLPLEDEGVKVGEKGKRRLGEMGIEEWFAVQTAVLPLLLSPTASFSTTLYPPTPPRDLLVSAPTGSGKTLSYVVPVVEVLSRRVVTRLRALVLLPTRDLVGQVRETFEQYARGSGLKIGVATGQHSFAHEQSVLVGSSVPSDLAGGSSQVDILIATPGRLMDHLKSTPGFSLQHLRFLVVDEADRLLTQSFHDWLPTVLAALKPPSSTPAPSAEDDESAPALAAAASQLEAGAQKPQGLKTADAMAPLWWDAEGREGRMVQAEGIERCHGSCQKLLFSATLSRDPAKIDALQLSRPIYISVEDALDASLDAALDAGDVDEEKRFTFPATLTEHMLISPASHKPLNLFHLLHHPEADRRVEKALCFTKSVEAATRLAKLVELFEEARGVREGESPVVVRAFSSELAPGERKKVLKDFKDGKITMLIASDLISRGIDLPSVSHVISYDIPSDMRKYVHRVGRTARAGQAGSAWSLVEEQEVAPFKAIMNAAQHYDKIRRVKVKEREVEGFVDAYQVALEKLRLHFATGGAKERVREEQQQAKA